MAKYSTRQRDALLDYLEKHAHELLSAKQIADELKDCQISISAVYRNLAELEKENKVKRCTQNGKRQVLYQYIAAHHCENKLHISCKLCGTTFHLEESVAKDLINHFSDSMNFTVIPQDTTICGICPNCKK